MMPCRLTPSPRDRAPRHAAQVRAKTFVAVGHETANNRGKRALGGKGEAMDADLLANMELGVHAPAAGGPPAGAAAGGAGMARAAPSGAGDGAPPDSPTDAAGGELYFRGAALPDDDGIELSSAPVRADQLSALAERRRGENACRACHPAALCGMTHNGRAPLLHSRIGNPSRPGILLHPIAHTVLEGMAM